MIDTQEDEEMDDADAVVVDIVEGSSRYIPIHETQFRDRALEFVGNLKIKSSGVSNPLSRLGFLE
jgi:hypothetical protein